MLFRRSTPGSQLGLYRKLFVIILGVFLAGLLNWGMSPLSESLEAEYGRRILGKPDTGHISIYYVPSWPLGAADVGEKTLGSLLDLFRETEQDLYVIDVLINLRREDADVVEVFWKTVVEECDNGKRFVFPDTGLLQTGGIKLLSPPPELLSDHATCIVLGRISVAANSRMDSDSLVGRAAAFLKGSKAGNPLEVYELLGMQDAISYASTGDVARVDNLGSTVIVSSLVSSATGGLLDIVLIDGVPYLGGHFIASRLDSLLDEKGRYVHLEGSVRIVGELGLACLVFFAASFSTTVRWTAWLATLVCILWLASCSFGVYFFPGGLLIALFLESTIEASLKKVERKPQLASMLVVLPLFFLALAFLFFEVSVNHSNKVSASQRAVAAVVVNGPGMSASTNLSPAQEEKLYLGIEGSLQTGAEIYARKVLADEKHKLGLALHH